MIDTWRTDVSPKSLYSDYAGADTVWFTGKVISNNDPMKLGRVQIRIFGMHSNDIGEVPTNALPWAQTLNSAGGGVSGIGTFSSMIPGAFVFGIFLDGRHAQIPFVIGFSETLEGPSNTQKTDPTAPILPDRDKNRDPIDTQTPVDMTDALEGGSNAEKIFNFYTSNGFTSEQASGFIGNFFAESNLNPEALNPNDLGKPAFGLAQWRGDRLENLKSWSEGRGLDYRTLKAQLQFSLHELSGTERNAGAKIRRAATARESAYVMCRYYERPSYEIVNGNYTSPSLSLRIQVSKDAYERFARA
tara:strand:+ start:7517 stop:8422 length:906 start_codon:yes stop_codon:yes gene_type:complete